MRRLLEAIYRWLHDPRFLDGKSIGPVCEHCGRDVGDDA